MRCGGRSCAWATRSTSRRGSCPRRRRARSTSRSEVRDSAGDAFIWQRPAGDAVKGKTAADCGLRAQGVAGPRLAAQDAVPAAAGRTGRRAWQCSERRRRTATELTAAWSASRRKPAWASRGSWRSSCVKPVGRGRSSRSASVRPSAPRPPTSCGRRSGAACSASTTRLPRRSRSPRCEQRLRGFDERLVARAPLLDEVVGLSIPDNDADEDIRREAPQDVA